MLTQETLHFLEMFLKANLESGNIPIEIEAKLKKGLKEISLEKDLLFEKQEAKKQFPYVLRKDRVA